VPIKGIEFESKDIIGPWVELKRTDKGEPMLGNTRVDFRHDGTYRHRWYLKPIGSAKAEKEPKEGLTMRGIQDAGTYSIEDKAILTVQSLRESSTATPIRRKYVMDSTGNLLELEDGKLSCRLLPAILAPGGK
jgi:hypothetical protein